MTSGIPSSPGIYFQNILKTKFAANANSHYLLIKSIVKKCCRINKEINYQSIVKAACRIILLTICFLPHSSFATKAKCGNEFYAIAGLSKPRLLMNLYGVNADTSTYTADGATVLYDDSYSNNVDGMDAVKLTNTGENLAVKTANTLLVVERRHTIVEKDTSFLNLTNMKTQQYRFDFEATQLNEPGLVGFLEDTYLHTSTPLNLSGSTVVDFNIENIPASHAANRFRIVFSTPIVLPLTFTSIKAYVKNKDIALEWQVENESDIKKYTIEKSVDGNHYKKVNTGVADNTALSNYSWLDINPAEGDNYYRVLSTGIAGKIEYSKVVKVCIGKKMQNIAIYPNPISNGIINLQLTNQPAGVYAIRILNRMAQVVLSKNINHTEGSNTETIQLDKYAAHGIYQLAITRPDRTTTNISVIY